MTEIEKVRRKIEEGLGKKFPKQNTKWMTERSKNVDNPFIKLHNEIIDFFLYYGPSKEEDTQRKMLFTKVKTLIKNAYPDAKVKVFGSCATGLYLP